MDYNNLVYRDEVKRTWNDLTSLERKIISDVLLDINGDNMGKESVTLTYAIDETDTDCTIYWYMQMIEQFQLTQALLSENMQMVTNYKKTPLGRF